jgi:hypothetical protein
MRLLTMALIGGVLAAMVAIAPTVGVARTESANGTNAFGGQPARVTDSCFWGVPIARGEGGNILAPDTNATYYYVRYRVVPGTTVTLRGWYPHARYMSFTSYKTVGGLSGIVNTALDDVNIAPDPGSTNPFDAGAVRTAPRRRFTVTLSTSGDPGSGKRRPNTLYTGQAGNTAGITTVELILRIYLPDRGDVAGGVPLPEPTVTLPNGAISHGRQACTTLAARTGFTDIPAAAAALSVSAYKSLLSLSPVSTHPAANPIHFYRFFNMARLVEPFYVGTSLSHLISSLPTNIEPAFYATAANGYLTGYADRTFGPLRNGHNILVLRGRMPTHPDTFGHNPRSPAHTQVRYWSLCAYGALSDPPLLPVDSPCLYDEQVPVNARGFYTIVVSLPQDRPSNATETCGVAWLNWGTAGDGLARPRLIDLALRYLDGARWFRQRPDDVLVPGTEKRVMGDYLPSGRYTDRRDFQTRGCPRAN